MMKKLLLFTGIAALLLCVGMGNAAGEETRIAVAANDNTAQAVVCAEAARCSYYLIFNGDGTFVETIENPQKNARRGAGPSAAAFLAERGVTMAIAVQFGVKMANALKERGIAHVEYKGAAVDAVKSVLKGK